MSRIVTIDLDSLDSNDQRSFAMLRRTKGWGKAVRESRKVSEAVAPVETTKPKLTVVYEKEAPVKRHKTTVIKAARNPEPTREERIAALMAELLGDDTPKKAKKAKSNDFFEEVIVKRAKKRTATHTYECEEPDCYKFGHKFSKVGWFGTATSNGHIDIAAAHK